MSAASSQKRSESRYLSLWFPHLPTERIARLHGKSFEAPLALVGDVQNARLLTSLDAEAAKLGLRTGMRLADARAMYPFLHILDADPVSDRKFLERIADWCERYTPFVALDEPHGLLLDITGCTHLWNGEAGLAADLLKRLQTQGLRARIGIAGSVGCAWAAAHHAGTRNRRIAIVPSGGEAKALASLPLAALRLPEKSLDGLREMGFTRIGDIDQQSLRADTSRIRAPMAARFGEILLRRLDQAYGLQKEPINPRRPLPDFTTEERFAEPLLLAEHVLLCIGKLAEKLGCLMERHAVGARRVEVALFHVDGSVKRIALGLSKASRDPALIARLFTDRLAVLGDEADPGFGFDMLRLSALVTGRIEFAQSGFMQADDGSALAQLVDRLGARFGPARMLRFALEDTHIPERAMRTLPIIDASERKSLLQESAPSTDSGMAERPLRLLDPPERIDVMAEVPDGPPLRFRWRRVAHDVKRAEGPERIAPEWWRGAEDYAPTRDYFRVEDKKGLRLWIFREGLYGYETASPRWYMHGLFA